MIGLIIIVIALVAILTDIYEAKTTKYYEFAPLASSIALFIILFILILTAKPPTKTTIVHTQTTDDTYLVDKNQNVYVKHNHIIKRYTKQIKTIDYADNINQPKIELTTFTDAKEYNLTSFKLGERNITYRTEITKLILPEKILHQSDDLQDAQIVYRK